VPTPTFQLSLLGRFELAGPDGAIDLTSKKLAGLLAFLACTAPQPQSRDQLMALLWGSHFQAQARQNLRQALTRLRRVLGEDTLISTSESVSLQPGVIACSPHPGCASRDTSARKVLKARAASISVVVPIQSPEEIARRLEEDTRSSAEAIRVANIKLE
jgi:hypothetical protein